MCFSSYAESIALKTAWKYLFFKETLTESLFQATAKSVIYKINDLSVATLSTVVSGTTLKLTGHKWSKDTFYYSLDNLVIQILDLISSKIFPLDEKQEEDFKPLEVAEVNYLVLIVKTASYFGFTTSDYRIVLKRFFIWTLSLFITNIILYYSKITPVFLTIYALIPYLIYAFLALFIYFVSHFFLSEKEQEMTFSEVWESAKVKLQSFLNNF